MTWLLNFLMWFHFGDERGPGFFQILLGACFIFGFLFTFSLVAKWLAQLMDHFD